MNLCGLPLGSNERRFLTDAAPANLLHLPGGIGGHLDMMAPVQRTRPHPDGLVPFFVLTFIITWGLGAFAIFLPGQFMAFFGELTDTSPVYFLAVAAPTISATILTAMREGRAELRALYARLVHWRFGIEWYALVLVGIPVLGWLIAWITGPEPRFDLSTPLRLLTILFSLLISGPLGEELGWRGFALPRLLERFRPFAASLILGVIWGLWHLPSFFISGVVQSQLSLPVFLIGALVMSILVTWMFQHTGGSVLIAVLFHYMVNFNFAVIGVSLPAFMCAVLLGAGLVVVFDREVFGPLKASENTTALLLSQDRQIV